MKEFNSFDAFAKHIEKITSQYQDREYKALDFLGGVLEEEAKHTIGHLQNGAGNFQSWPDLAESTKIDKLRKGYVFNDDYNPLYRTGDLKESIHHVVNRTKQEVYIGSPSDIALYQEIGTANIPARSFLGLTLFKAKDEIQYILGEFLIQLISGQRQSLKRIHNGSL